MRRRSRASSKVAKARSRKAKAPNAVRQNVFSAGFVLGMLGMYIAPLVWRKALASSSTRFSNFLNSAMIASSLVTRPA